VQAVNLNAPSSGRDRSWWQRDVMTQNIGEADEAGRPGQTGQLDGTEVEVVIVGGGFTGLWTALTLKERAPDLRIMLVEANRCGSGASGMNGGKCHGYWGSLPGLVASLGPDGALAVCRASSRAQDGIRDFVKGSGADVWWRDAGHAKVSTSPAQDKSIDVIVDLARELGVADMAIRLEREETQAICGTAAFRKAVFFPEGANLHPARLVQVLKHAVLDRGVRIVENTAVKRVTPGKFSRVEMTNGAVVARDVVLAANTGLAGIAGISSHVSVFSSYAVMTEPAPEQLEEAGWTNGIGLSDGRMFIHYFRTTADGRVLMGSGSGPIAYGGQDGGAAMWTDPASIGRAEAGIRRLLPFISDVAIDSGWGGAIDVSSDRLPIFRTIEGTRIHYGCGFSGHGINPSYIAGQCIASLVQRTEDDWTALPFCRRTLPTLPPEPFRYVGGNIVRWGIMTREDAEDRQVRTPLLARAAAGLPRAMGLKIGVR